MAGTQHTPEPWTALPYGLIRGGKSYEYTRGSAQQQIASVCLLEEDNGSRDANARRIVAAVNACRGIPTEGLEAGVVADLLAACIAMRRTMYSPDSEESRLADAAIAKARGESA